LLSLSVALAFSVILSLTGNLFISTQSAQAATIPLCGPASGTGAETVTATKVSYGGKLFDIIGYNPDGITGDTVMGQKAWPLSKSKLVIPARPAGPSVTGVAPSDVGASDGKITGASNKMEYSTDGISWTAANGSTIKGLTSGTYFVRTIADQSAKKFKSFATTVIVPAGSSGPSAKPSVGGEDSTVGTAQTGIDLVGLELLLVVMLLGVVVFRRLFRTARLIT
jgi:hypothetical protein